MEQYTVTIIMQSAGGTYTKTLVFPTADQAEKMRAMLVEQIEEVWGTS